ncbi:MucR family transcriptional regulator [Methylobacterium durans]|uniref:MucR family transcriptional regulator n=1 Tax=Methylobacterium durans TaxID=2202825 RepID=A0A2U8WE36_9HYPH|nr:MucR family transcriptional regulator [Methylobacterium durans]AWN43566.1 MucR family transcriptional regulator [Methylobacterium durans]
MQERAENSELNPIDVAAEIVSAYVANNSVSQAELPALIASVHTALSGLGKPARSAEQQFEKATPAQIKASISPDALISFIDGKPYKALKRHLTTHGLDPVAYCQRYGLPYDYPMVTASYAAQRSELAKASGLGQARRDRGT